MRRLFSLIGILSLGTLGFSSLVNAAAPPAVFKDSAGSIYIHSGVNAGDRVKVELVGQPYKRTVKAGACGQISLGTSSSMPSVGNSVTIDGTSVTLTSVTTSSPVPKCTNGAYSPATTTNFKTATGRYELVGYTAGQSYEVLFNDVNNHFNVTVNGCGFAVVKSTTNHPLSTSQVTINGTSYTISSLTTADPPLCRKSGSTTTMYTPASWGN